MRIPLRLLVLATWSVASCAEPATLQPPPTGPADTSDGVGADGHTADQGTDTKFETGSEDLRWVDTSDAAFDVGQFETGSEDLRWADTSDAAFDVGQKELPGDANYDATLDGCEASGGDGHGEASADLPDDGSETSADLAAEVAAEGCVETDAAEDVPAQELPVEESAPEVEVPDCGGYPEFAGAKFCGVPLAKKTPGIRLLFSYQGVDTDNSVCGKTTWRLGNRISLSGTTVDGMQRGRLTGADLFYDVDAMLEDDDYYGPDGAVKRYPFIVELLDAEGNVLWRGRRPEPLRVREFLMAALDQYTTYDPVPLMVPLVQAAVNADFEAMSIVVPALPAATHLRFSREMSAAEKAAVPQCDTGGPLVLPVVVSEQQAAETTVSLDDIPDAPMADFTALAPGLEVIRLWGTADPANAVDLVIIGDGYTSAQKLLFEGDAQAVADMVATIQPLKTYSKHVNVWRIWAPSAESGASFDCGCSWFDSPAKQCSDPSSECKDGFRDTMFGSIFTIRALYGLMPMLPPPAAATDRNLFPLYLFRIAMAQSLSAADGTPVSGDAAFVLTNTGKKGAFGLYNAATSTGYAIEGGLDHLAEVATHEMGHAFGGLGDEYSVATDICQIFELTPLFPNFSGIPAGAVGLPWKPWVTLAPPYPNTEDQGSAGDIGCFVPGPGGGKCCVGGNCANGDLACRPSKTCKMKTNGGNFCPVCRDHLIRQIFRYVDLLESPLFDVSQTSETVFNLGVSLSESSVDTTWSIDGEAVQTGPYAPLELDVSSLSVGVHVVKLDVSLASEWVKIWTDAVGESITVEVTVQ